MVPPKSIVEREYYGKFEPGDRVLAAMTSFPPWPAFIADYKYLSKDVLKDRKYDDQIPVLFVPEFNYSWVKESHIEIFSDEMLKDGPSPSVSKKSKKSKLAPQLNASYKYFRENEGITYTDFLEIFGVEEPEVDEEKPKKNTKKTSIVSKKDTKSDFKKRKLSDSENGQDGAPEIIEKEKSPENSQKKLKEEPEIVKEEQEITKDVQLETSWKFRYHLQKGLLQRKSEPSKEDVANALKELQKLKAFDENGGVTARVLGITKLHKVLKEILKKPKFSDLHSICKQLLESWSEIIEAIKKEKQADSFQHNNSRDLSDVSDIKHTPSSIKAE